MADGHGGAQTSSLRTGRQNDRGELDLKVQHDAGWRPWYTSDMADLQTIIRSVHDLSPQDKLVLREVIDRDLALTEQNSAGKTSELVGLFTDDSQLLDEVMDLVYQGRGRPWRAA